MSYVRHDVVLVVVPGYVHRGESVLYQPPDVDTFRKALPPAWRVLVVGPIHAPAEDVITYAFMPDGSNEGWPESDEGDGYRAKFMALFDKTVDGGSAYDGITIRFGGAEPDGGHEPEVQFTPFPRARGRHAE